jgi:site-specific DNA recombinase
MTQVLEQLRVGLHQASFQQRRQLVELLIDRVVVTDGQVEIRYVIPTTDNSTKTRFVTCIQTISTWLRRR